MRRVFTCLVFVVHTLSPAHAQVPAAPAGTGGGGGAPASTGGGGSGGLSAGGGLGGEVFVPSNLPSDVMNLGATNPGAMGIPQAPAVDPTGGLIAACLQGISGLTSMLGANNREARAIREAADRANDEAGFVFDEGVDKEWAGTAASSFGSLYENAGSCEQKFISKEGALGSWARTVHEEMERHKDVYVSKVPADINGYCPAFSQMDEVRRKYYWTWFFASLASPESSCNPKAVNKNAPNGSAIGLFQLETKACVRVGYHYSSEELLEPHNNIRCAVALFADEMRSRNTIFIGHSRGRGGTYWGPLRNDDHNRARGGDIRGSQKTRGLLSQYADCQASSEQNSAPTN